MSTGLRVLHVQRVSGVGGSERHLAALLPALAAEGLDVHMCVLAAGDAHRFLGDLDAAGVPVTAIPAGPDLNPVALQRLRRLIRSWRPDIVHTHLIHGDVHGQVAARLGSVAAISSFHASPSLYRRPPYRTVARLAATLPRLTIAISGHLARFLAEQKLCRPDRIRVIHYGIDSGGWLFPEAERALGRRELGLGPPDIAVGVASRLIREKGHADLIEAFAVARRRVPPLRLLIAGIGDQRDDLERLARARLPEGSYRFLGFVDDIRSFMNACDIFTFPTTPDFGEGFGMAALEASAAGRPIIATAVGPLPEVVSDDESGLIVPPRSLVSLADALVRMALDGALRQRLGEGAARRARREFGLERMVGRTVAVYDEVAGAVGPPDTLPRRPRRGGT